MVVGSGSTMGRDQPLIADATEWNGTIYLSGRADVDPATLEVRSDDFAQQAKSVLRDIFRVLEECGSGPDRVLRVECYLARPADFDTWNAVFAESFPRSRPARTTIVASFPVPGLLVEIQATAAVAP
ncbi:MAG TPA: RidA family protein [Solirubrobacteraceae bacterium]|jgi:2-iminobutanoate/2-iminopropanoate deaminase